MAVTIDGSANTVTARATQSLVSGTAVASTSGTSIDFTGIPSWVKRITVMFNGVSLSATAAFLVKIGTSSGIESTGYLSGSSHQDNTSTSGQGSTAGFIVRNASAAILNNGIMTICNVSSNTWVASHSFGSSVTIFTKTGGGSKTLAGVLDRIQITADNGTDTFDAGSINIMYE